MERIKVIVHLSLEPETPLYQLELAEGKVVILDYCNNMDEADDVLKAAIQRLQEVTPEEMPPTLLGKHFMFSYHFEVFAFLEAYKDIFTQSNLARLSGINTSLLNQYLSKNQDKTLSEKQLNKIEDTLHRLGLELQNIKLTI